MSATLARARWLRAPESRRVLAALAAGGRPARFVGGCVRDTLLDPALDMPDLDLATPEPPERVTVLCEAAGLKVIPTGLEHGTVTVLGGGHRFEVTTLRRDVATDGRHAVVEFTDDFAEDAARRDLTINAMSCDGEGQLFDPFAGEADLHAGRIRFVGDPATRIREDYLRILRFFRFYGRFGRPPADGAALAACRELALGIDRLSGERVRQELLRLLETRRAVPTLELMQTTGVLRHILPEPPDFTPLARLTATWPKADGLLRLATLLRSAGTDQAAIERLASRLRLSTREHDRLLALVTPSLPDPEACERAHRHGLYAHSPALYLDLLRLATVLDDRDPASAHAVEALAAHWQAPAFPIGGDDLLARGIPPGPGLGAILGELRRWWQAQDFTPDRAACLARLDTLLAQETREQHP